MKRKQTLTHLFLIFLLLAASEYYYNTPIMVQAIAKVDFKLGPAQPRSRFNNGQSIASQENTRKQFQGEMIRKIPSGPSPIGNRKPPSNG